MITGKVLLKFLFRVSTRVEKKINEIIEKIWFVIMIYLDAGLVQVAPEPSDVPPEDGLPHPNWSFNLKSKGHEVN
jgi:hypothetical protein